MQAPQLVFVLALCLASAVAMLQAPWCPTTASSGVQDDMGLCAEELKDAILREYAKSVAARRTRSAEMSDEDRLLVGCMVSCLFRKGPHGRLQTGSKLALAELGAMRLFSDGAKDARYLNATADAVRRCSAASRSLLPDNGGPRHECELGFFMFECVSDQITEYCQWQKE
ncbi:general odorant-binding protein 70 [Schistocerca cancellata]|uniref:general odorant-binding protein 70 n=1 Tax=Schistocerca cancellata TaxID=274614 RepID=UPI002118B14D|nr:general odorant-binding protein 70 [Schistocerca cancellata]